MKANGWKWFIGFGIVLGATYGALPPAQSKLIVWPLVGWSSVIAIAIGVWRNRPAYRAPWVLLALGIATFTIGDDLYTYRNYIQHAEALFPSYVDLVYLALYPLLIAGLGLMVHHRSAGKDRASVIDAAIITGGLGLIGWVFLIAPYVRQNDLGLVERLVSIAYPLGDIALLAIVVRLAVGSGRRPMAFWLLAGSIIPLLVADGLYGYMNLAGTWHEHNIVDVGWIAFYVGWGAAALHPSMTELTIASPIPRKVSARRLMFVGGAVIVPPAVLFVQQGMGPVVDGAAIAIIGAVTLVMVMIRVAGLARDVADERNETRFRTLVDKASDAIVVVDVAGVVSYHTPSTERVLGPLAAGLDGRPLADLLGRKDAEDLNLILTGSNMAATVEWHVHHGDGEWRDLEVFAADMRGVADVDGMVLTMRDITDRKHLDGELRRQALHDALTGLPNRTLFLDRVGHALSRAVRTSHLVGVLFLDLDDFKMVNDSLGHSAGDELLVSVAERVSALIEGGDTFARLGGDEFALLLENGSVGVAIEAMADRVIEALREPFRVGHDRVLVLATIGLAVGGPVTHSADDLLREADVAMYVAKRNGKARYQMFEESMHDDARYWLEIGAELSAAIGREELVVFYQPIVDVHTGRTRGAEALVRWQHPRRGLMQPAEFIPVAETTGLIIAVDQWVLDHACYQAQQWKQSGATDDDFYITVNLSARHVQDPRVVNHVVDSLRRSQLAPSALVLEVTETALIFDLEKTRATLAELKQLGVRLAVDDFGTGYSSLSYLSAFPLDIIKIDKSFIDQLTMTADGDAMVRAVVDLAHTLGLVAVAEGVEQQVQAHALEDLGCTLAQGYLFAKPKTSDDMTRMLTATDTVAMTTS